MTLLPYKRFLAVRNWFLFSIHQPHFGECYELNRHRIVACHLYAAARKVERRKWGKKRKRCTHGFMRFTWVLLFTGYCRVVASSVDNIAMALILNHFYIIYYYDFIQFHWFCVNLNMASSHENGINICHKYMRILLFALNWRFNLIQFECSTEIVCYTF